PAERPAIAPPAPSSAAGTTAPAAGASEYAKAQPTGDDAAYEAFDQGKYLTALDLAQRLRRRAIPRPIRWWDGSMRRVSAYRRTLHSLQSGMHALLSSATLRGRSPTG